MTTEPTAGVDAIDRANAAFWQPGVPDAQIFDAEPLAADETFVVPDLTEDEWKPSHVR